MNKIWRIIFVISILVSCQNEQNLKGNYYTCDDNGEYLEVYFKKGFIRIATDNEWVKLSKWRKTEFENDTLKFETFGEWREPIKVIVDIGTNNIKMQILKKNEAMHLKRFKENPNFEKKEEFWNGFHNRKNENCD